MYSATNASHGAGSSVRPSLKVPARTGFSGVRDQWTNAAHPLLRELPLCIMNFSRSADTAVLPSFDGKQGIGKGADIAVGRIGQAAVGYVFIAFFQKH